MILHIACFKLANESFDGAHKIPCERGKHLCFHSSLLLANSASSLSLSVSLSLSRTLAQPARRASDGSTRVQMDVDSSRL